MKTPIVLSAAPVAGSRGFASNAEVAFGGAETVKEEFIDWIRVHRKLVKLDGKGKPASQRPAQRWPLAGGGTL